MPHSAIPVRWFAPLVLLVLVLAAPSIAVGMEYGEGRLFAVVGPEGQRSWVFATLHDDARDIVSLPRSVSRALSRSRFLLLAVRPDGNAVEALKRQQYLPEDDDLEGLLGTELYAWLARTLKEDGIDDCVLRRWRPWVAMAALASTPAIGEDHLHQRLHSLARRQGMAIHGLETADERIRRVDGLPEADQIGLLRHVLEQRAELPEERAARRVAYRHGDLAALRERYREQLARLDRPLRQAFRQHMGEGWQTRITERAEPFLRAGGAFIALEGQYLAGPDGFLARLEERGFRVERRY